MAGGPTPGSSNRLLRANNLVAETGANKMTAGEVGAQEVRMKLLVTGGAGFIGSNFIRHVLGLGAELFGRQLRQADLRGESCQSENPSSTNPRYQFVKGDICDAAAVEAAMAGCDAVVHFAAESHVDRSIYEPAAVNRNKRQGNFRSAPSGAKAECRTVHSYFHGRSLRRHAARRLRG